MGSEREKQVVWVEDEVALKALAARMMRFRCSAIDTEQDAFHAFRAKICLIQIRTGGVEYAIDALRLSDLSPLAEPLGAEDRVTIAHAAENDVDLLRRGFGLHVRGLFDTMAAAHRLGYSRCGLARLVEEHFGVPMDKRFQRSDWRKRPLSDEQIAYASRDVRFLPSLYRILSSKLREAGLLETAAADFRRIERVEHAPKRYRIDDYRRVGGYAELAPREQRVFRVLHALRQRVAHEDDRALFRVCGNQALLALAHAVPVDPAALDRVRGVPSRFKAKHRDQVLALIQASLAREGKLEVPRGKKKISASAPRRSLSRRSAATRNEP